VSFAVRLKVPVARGTWLKSSASHRFAIEFPSADPGHFLNVLDINLAITELSGPASFSIVSNTFSACSLATSTSTLSFGMNFTSYSGPR